jgi:RNA polymerase subunit RPABC4/transcription elongation factor Spt4
MRYCWSCRKITANDPAYCNYCGKSYDVKLCGRGHKNVRAAEVCSACGSRDLSVPQNRPSMKTFLFQVFAMILPFIVLLVLTLGYIFVFLKTLFENPSALLPFMLLGLPLGVLWLIWIFASSMLRELLFGKSSRGNRR